MSKRLSEASVRKAIADAAAGQTYDVSDLGAPGLVLRVAPRGASWAFRSSVHGRSIRLRLGSVTLFGLTVARDLASAAMLMVRERGDWPNEAWLERELVSRRIIEPPSPEPRPEPGLKPLPRWTYRQAMEAYLVEVQETLRPATYRDRRSMLKIAEMQPFFDRPVASITRQELSAVVAHIAKTRERHAKHLCEVLRPMWTWLSDRDEQQLQSGILGTPMAMLKPPKKRRVTIEQAEAKTTYLPPVQELGRILAMAQAAVMGEVMSDAALLTLYTAQRRLTIAQARRKDFVEEEGDLIWKIPQAYMKAGEKKPKPHELPLPRGAAAMVRRRLAIETEMAGLAAARRTNEDISAMRDALRRIREAEDPAIAATADSQFHMAIARATRNDYYARFVEFLGVRLVPPSSLYLKYQPERSHDAYTHKVSDEHDAVLDAIVRMDIEKARHAARHHMQESLLRHSELNDLISRDE